MSDEKKYSQLTLPNLNSIVILAKLNFREANILFGEPDDVTYGEFIELFEKLLFELDERECARDLVRKYRITEENTKQ